MLQNYLKLSLYLLFIGIARPGWSTPSIAASSPIFVTRPASATTFTPQARAQAEVIDAMAQMDFTAPQLICPIAGQARCDYGAGLLAISAFAAPVMAVSLPSHLGPARSAEVEIRLMNRVMYRTTPATTRVIAKLGSDQMLLDIERARGSAEPVALENRAPQWATLTMALAAGSLVFAGRRPDRSLPLAAVQQWQRPPPVCCWSPIMLENEPGMRLCGDLDSGHLWPGNWRCGGTCPPPPNENGGMVMNG